MGKRWLICAVVIGAAGSARAEEERPTETGRTAAQFLVGAATATAGFVGAVSGSGGSAIPLLATPAAVGGLVCAIGNAGAYRGSCAASIIGAYLGAATMFPLEYLLDQPGPTGGGDALSSSYAYPWKGILAGWIIAQPLLAVASWHLWKRPRKAPTIALTPGGFLLRATF